MPEEKLSLFARRPERRARTAATITGSLLIHAAVIGVAAFRPISTGVATPAPGPTEVVFEPYDSPGLLLLPPPKDDVIKPEAILPPTPPTAEDDTPPPTEDAEMATPSDEPEQTPKRDRPKSLKLPNASPKTPGRSNPTLSLPGAKSGLQGVAPTSVKPGGGWHTPRPPYPYIVRASHVQGSGSVRVSTDASGKVISAVIGQSSGNAILDSNTVSYAKGNWSGPANSTQTVQIIYQIQ